MAETHGADPNPDLPTQKLPRASDPQAGLASPQALPASDPLPPTGMAALAAHMLEPSDPGAEPTITSQTPPRGSPPDRTLADFGLAKLAESDLTAHAEGSQGRLDDAMKRIGKALLLAPDDRDVKDLVARIHVARGRGEAKAYADARKEVERLEREEEASGIPADATDEQADTVREAEWKRTEALKEARRERGRTWSEADRPFHEALTFVSDHPEAKKALAELYWDEYVRNEALRERAEEARYQKLVEDYGGQEYKDRVRGEKEVRVAFLLPAACLARAEREPGFFRRKAMPTPSTRPSLRRGARSGQADQRCRA